MRVLHTSTVCCVFLLLLLFCLLFHPAGTYTYTRSPPVLLPTCRTVRKKRQTTVSFRPRLTKRVFGSPSSFNLTQLYIAMFLYVRLPLLSILTWLRVLLPLKKLSVNLFVPFSSLSDGVKFVQSEDEHITAGARNRTRKNDRNLFFRLFG